MHILYILQKYMNILITSLFLDVSNISIIEKYFKPEKYWTKRSKSYRN